MHPHDAERRARLRQLAALFLKLGALSFGGPAAHIAMMRDEVVVRRGWIDDRRFLDLLAAANLIPGPTSTELAIHIGWERARWLGLFVAGCSFIAPAMLITAAIGWAYVAWGTLPAIAGVLYGVKPVVVVIVLQAIRGLAPSAVRTAPLAALGVIALVALLAFGADELLVLFGCGAVMLLGRVGRVGATPGSRVGAAALCLPAMPWAAATATTATAAASAAGLFVVFLKIGAVLFGSGYVLLAFLQSELVERLGWLTEAQALDAIAVGQVTPGPVFTTATFVGYVLAGPLGACAATAGIFLPAFAFVALVGPFVPRLRGNAFASAFLDGVTVASLALMVAVTVRLCSSAVVDGWTAVVLAIAAALHLWRRVGPTWLLAGGAVVGLALTSIGAA